jgi:hypothetical protein
VNPPATSAGRSCPLHYRYAPSVFAQAAARSCETLYVAGGLYGNEPALQTLLALFEREQGDKCLMFNGDFHWFDTDPVAFKRINDTVLSMAAIRGNVETELAQADSSGDEDFGCGCAYPEWVGDAIVQRSNRILARLRHTAQTYPSAQQQLQALPMWARVDVGGFRVAVVHGDAQSLAGWGFAQEHLQDATHRHLLRDWFASAQVHAFACSHTCLPVFQALAPHGAWVLNNGAAGMPNFSGDTAGVLIRISLRRFDGPARAFGFQQGAVYVDALRIAYDNHAWQQQFLAQWPAGSDAHASYWQRIQQGPDYGLHQAIKPYTD